MNEIIQIGNIYPTKTRNNPNQGRVYDPRGISPTLNCMGGGNMMPFVFITGDENELERKRQKDSIGTISNIRRLTPKECFRLMGFDDADVDKLINNGISNSQLYKMAGNSIVTNVLSAIFGEMRKQGLI